MKTIVLQQGESVSLNVNLSTPLQEGYILHYALSNSKGIIKSGSTEDGNGIVQINSSRFIISLLPSETINLTKCIVEWAIADTTKSDIKISNEIINLEFRQTKIKNIISK